MNLVGTRPAVSDAHLRQLVLDVAVRPEHWLHLVRYDPGRRWYERLPWAGDQDVWLLSWLPGQYTGFHDHGRSAGAFTVVQGCLRERTAPRGRPDPVGAALQPGAARAFGPWYIHDVANDTLQPGCRACPPRCRGRSEQGELGRPHRGRPVRRGACTAPAHGSPATAL